MSFSFRDKPRLGDRLRGKSGDEILEEFQKALEENKKEREKRRNMFFESNPSWESRDPKADSFFSQAGYPFDDDFKSRIDNLTQRHPESADLFRNIIGNSWSKPGNGSPSNSSSNLDSQSVPESASHQQESTSAPSNQKTQDREGQNEIKQNLSQDSMRNTDQQNQVEEDSRNQRSWSAPPETKPVEPQRFVSKIEINPVNPEENNMNNSNSEQHQAPPAAPQSQTKPTVRHIPIFVEGRSEPVLPKELPTEEVFIPQRGPTPTFNSRPHHPSPRKSFEKQHVKDIPIHTNHQQHPQRQQQHPHQQQQQPHQQQPVSNNDSGESVEESARPVPPPPPPPKPKTAMEKVEEVQKEVDELTKQVHEYNGTSRQEKAYLYLDEMLTRELIKLDNIETEGREDIRMARKNAIKSIQSAISVLESKVPLPNSIEENNETAVVLYGGDADSEVQSTNTEQMEVDSTASAPQESHDDPSEDSTEIKKKKSDQ